MNSYFKGIVLAVLAASYTQVNADPFARFLKAKTPEVRLMQLVQLYAKVKPSRVEQYRIARSKAFKGNKKTLRGIRISILNRIKVELAALTADRKKSAAALETANRTAQDASRRVADAERTAQDALRRAADAERARQSLVSERDDIARQLRESRALGTRVNELEELLRNTRVTAEATAETARHRQEGLETAVANAQRDAAAIVVVKDQERERVLEELRRDFAADLDRVRGEAIEQNRRWLAQAERGADERIAQVKAEKETAVAEAHAETAAKARENENALAALKRDYDAELARVRADVDERAREVDTAKKEVAESERKLELFKADANVAIANAAKQAEEKILTVKQAADRIKPQEFTGPFLTMVEDDPLAELREKLAQEQQQSARFAEEKLVYRDELETLKKVSGESVEKTKELEQANSALQAKLEVMSKQNIELKTSKQELAIERENLQKTLDEQLLASRSATSYASEIETTNASLKLHIAKLQAINEGLRRDTTELQQQLETQKSAAEVSVKQMSSTEKLRADIAEKVCVEHEKISAEIMSKDAEILDLKKQIKDLEQQLREALASKGQMLTSIEVSGGAEFGELSEALACAAVQTKESLAKPEPMVSMTTRETVGSDHERLSDNLRLYEQLRAVLHELKDLMSLPSRIDAAAASAGDDAPSLNAFINFIARLAEESEKNIEPISLKYSSEGMDRVLFDTEILRGYIEAVHVWIKVAHILVFQSRQNTADAEVWSNFARQLEDLKAAQGKLYNSVLSLLPRGKQQHARGAGSGKSSEEHAVLSGIDERLKKFGRSAEYYGQTAVRRPKGSDVVELMHARGAGASAQKEASPAVVERSATGSIPRSAAASSSAEGGLRTTAEVIADDRAVAELFIHEPLEILRSMSQVAAEDPDNIEIEPRIRTSYSAPLPGIKIPILKMFGTSTTIFVDKKLKPRVIQWYKALEDFGTKLSEEKSCVSCDALETNAELMRLIKQASNISTRAYSVGTWNQLRELLLGERGVLNMVRACFDELKLTSLLNEDDKKALASIPHWGAYCELLKKQEIKHKLMLAAVQDKKREIHA